MLRWLPIAVATATTLPIAGPARSSPSEEVRSAAGFTCGPADARANPLVEGGPALWARLRDVAAAGIEVMPDSSNHQVIISSSAPQFAGLFGRRVAAPISPTGTFAVDVVIPTGALVAGAPSSGHFEGRLPTGGSTFMGESEVRLSVSAPSADPTACGAGSVVFACGSP